MDGKWFLVLVLALLFVGVVSANVTSERVYFSEETAIPFEVWVLLLGAGLLFTVLSAIVAFGGGGGGLTMVLGVVATLFMGSATFAAPVTGFFTYVTNSSTNATAAATPVVWLVLQPWMMWMLWGLTTIAFLMFVFGVLILMRDFRATKEDEERMYWV